MIPSFAIVGHPNKGKSSIVATLAQDDSAEVSPVPGTTTRCRRYPMVVDGDTLYVLIDTPGFQRARGALAWMQEHATSAAGRPDVVRAFVAAHSGSDHFRDECELLTPIIEGAGILYVTDGSKPYGADYEAEMEILRWTGQPSLALINTIGDEDHIAEWRAALGQYFRIVREFDAVTAEFDKRLELLGAFGALDEHWKAPLHRAVSYLREDRLRRRRQSARAIARMLVAMLSLRVRRRFPQDTDLRRDEQALSTEYLKKLRSLETRCRETVEGIYDHHGIERIEDSFALLEDDLFSQRSFQVFGLSRAQLVTSGAVGGATLGAGIDLAAGGASLMIGAGIGALLGGASALYSFNRVAEFKILGRPLGGIEAQVGPTRNVAFPYVVLGRALWHHDLVASRTHARRDVLTVNAPEHRGASSLPADIRKEFESTFTRVRRSAAEADGELIEGLSDLVERSMK